MTSVSDSRLMVSRLKPNSWMALKVGIRLSGMAIAAIAVARQLLRKTNTTSAASAMPSISTSSVALKDLRVSLTVETTSVNCASGWALATAAMAAFTPFSVRTSLALAVLSTWKATTGRPFSRAKPRCSAAPSPISATSDRVT